MAWTKMADMKDRSGSTQHSIVLGMCCYALCNCALLPATKKDAWRLALPANISKTSSQQQRTTAGPPRPEHRYGMSLLLFSHRTNIHVKEQL